MATYDVVERVNRMVRERRRFTTTELYAALYDILTQQLGYRKLCARWVPKQLTDEMCIRDSHTICVIFSALKKVKTHIFSVVLQFLSEIFWNNFCADFAHVQIIRQNFMNCLAI